MGDGFVALYIFMLAAIAGNVIISRVPVILHTPLMSGSNFIHGIVLIGAMVVLGHADTTLEKAIGFAAVKLVDDDTADLVLNAVHPDYRRRGVYRALLLESLAQARAALEAQRAGQPSGRLALSFEIIHGHAWVPQPSRLPPGYAPIGFVPKPSSGR